MPDQLAPDEERDLIAQLPEKPDGFRRLYRHYFPRIYGYVGIRIGNQQDTEDIVADIFMKIVESIEKFEYRGEGSFAAWAFRIAHNAVAQFYRQQHPVIGIDVATVFSRNSEEPDVAYSDKERSERLHAMLNTLSPRRQEIISLRYFGGLRNQEIAQVLGLNEKTVASHLSRGLEDLQKKYGQKDSLP